MATINKISTAQGLTLANRPISVLGSIEALAASSAPNLAALGSEVLPIAADTLDSAVVQPIFALDPIVVDTDDADDMSGDDTFYGNNGAYTFAGGAGNDTYYIDTSAVSGYFDSNGIFTAINGNDTVIENANEGIDTLYLVDLAPNRQFTLDDNIENVTVTSGYPVGHTTTHPDGALILSIGERSDGTNYRYVNGNALNNQIIGGAEDDWFDGKAGADTLVGGLGNDVYVLDNIGDVVTELANEGYDKVISGFDYTLGDNLEALILTGSANLTGTGNDSNNTLVGNAGDNLLLGGLGNDSIKGGGGNDTLSGGDGDDTFYFRPDQITAGNVDIITDFVSGSDKINLDGFTTDVQHFYAGADMTTAQSDGAQVIYDSNTGNLYYDADGIGGVDAIHFASLSGAVALVGSDVSGRASYYWVVPDILAY